VELLRLSPEEVFPGISYAPPPPSPGASAWVHAAAARRKQARAPAAVTSLAYEVAMSSARMLSRNGHHAEKACDADQDTLLMLESPPCRVAFGRWLQSNGRLTA
jgi:hypothetical protein